MSALCNNIWPFDYFVKVDTFQITAIVIICRVKIMIRDETAARSYYTSTHDYILLDKITNFPKTGQDSSFSICILMLT